MARNVPTKFDALFRLNLVGTFWATVCVEGIVLFVMFLLQCGIKTCVEKAENLQQYSIQKIKKDLLNSRTP
jgi:nucleoside recognition membrane protein YjiH